MVSLNTIWLVWNWNSCDCILEPEVLKEIWQRKVATLINAPSRALTLKDHFDEIAQIVHWPCSVPGQKVKKIWTRYRDAQSGISARCLCVVRKQSFLHPGKALKMFIYLHCAEAGYLHLCFHFEPKPCVSKKNCPKHLKVILFAHPCCCLCSCPTSTSRQRWCNCFHRQGRKRKWTFCLRLGSKEHQSTARHRSQSNICRQREAGQRPSFASKNVAKRVSNNTSGGDGWVPCDCPAFSQRQSTCKIHRRNAHAALSSRHFVMGSWVEGCRKAGSPEYTTVT